MILRRVENDIKTMQAAYKDLGVVGSFFSFTQGRATGFGLIFTICGLIGFFKHYDLTAYAMFVAAIFTGVVGHSIKEDYFQLKHRQLDQTTSTVSTKTEVASVVPAVKP
jgi:hypothetical protein